MKSETQEPRKILVIDVGGEHIKARVTGEREERKIPSGPKMTAAKMVRRVKKLVKDWTFDAISIGYPGVVIAGRPTREPHNLGGRWVGFDFAKAFGRPVKIVNDAAMQALGTYKSGRMLFLGFGAGLGSAMIVDGVLQPMELAHLPYKHGRTYEDYLGARGLKRLGKKRWRHHVAVAVKGLKEALGASCVVLGGGNAKSLKKAAGARIGNNQNAFAGGARLWDVTAAD